MARILPVFRPPACHLSLKKKWVFFKYSYGENRPTLLDFHGDLCCSIFKVIHCLNLLSVWGLGPARNPIPMIIYIRRDRACFHMCLSAGIWILNECADSSVCTQTPAFSFGCSSKGFYMKHFQLRSFQWQYSQKHILESCFRLLWLAHKPSLWVGTWYVQVVFLFHKETEVC